MSIRVWEDFSRPTKNKRQPAPDCYFYTSRRKDGREYPSLSGSTPNSSLTREDWRIQQTSSDQLIIWSQLECVFSKRGVWFQINPQISGAWYLQCERAVEAEATGSSINHGEGWKCPTHVCLPLGRLPLKALTAPRNRNWQFLNVYSNSHLPSEETHQKYLPVGSIQSLLSNMSYILCK